MFFTTFLQYVKINANVLYFKTNVKTSKDFLFGYWQMLNSNFWLHSKVSQAAAASIRALKAVYSIQHPMISLHTLNILFI